MREYSQTLHPVQVCGAPSAVRPEYVYIEHGVAVVVPVLDLAF